VVLPTFGKKRRFEKKNASTINYLGIGWWCHPCDWITNEGSLAQFREIFTSAGCILLL